jgi:hypothetical protein
MTVPVPSGRSTFKTSPHMGLPSRWCVGDLPQSYAIPVVALNQVNTTTTSAAISTGANSVELWTGFADPNTSCDILVFNLVNGTYVQVASFTGVNMFKESNLYVGQLDQGITLNGQPIKIEATNFVTNNGAAPGTVTISVNMIN